MEWLIIILAVLGLGLGLGLSFFKVIPKIVPRIIGVFATGVLVVMLWGLIGLPEVELLESFSNSIWVLAPALGLLVGDRVGDLFNM